MRLATPALAPRRLASVLGRVALGTLLLHGATARPLAAASPPRAERFYYQVTFGKAHVANVNLFTGCPQKTSTPWALVAVSQGMAQQLHAFSVRFDSFLDLKAPKPLLGLTQITEEGETRSYRTSFADAPTLQVTATLGAQAPSQRQVTLPGGHVSHDMISWIAHLRQEPVLARDASYEYWVWDGWKLFTLQARVEGQTTLSTPAGDQRVWSIRLDRTRRHHQGAKLHQPSRAAQRLGRLYLTIDALRRPVGMDFEARVGAAYVRLQRQRHERCEAP